MMSPAIQSLLIFGICVIFFVFNILPIDITALLGLILMIISGIISFETAFKNFGCQTVILICSMMVVGKAIFQTGLAQIIGKKVIMATQGNERKLVILSTTITALLSAFFSNVATLSIMLSILAGICANNRQVKFMNVAMPVSIAAVVGGSATLIGSTPQLTAQGILEQYLGIGNGFKFYTFLIPSSVIIVVLLLYVFFIGYPLGIKVWGTRDAYNEVPMNLSDTSINYNISKVEAMTIIFSITVVALIFCDWIKKLVPTINIALISLISAITCILCGCIDHKTALKSINWSLVIWFASCLGIAGGLESSGGAKLIADCFVNLWKSKPNSFLIYMMFILIAIIFTQFISNSTVLTIILPVVCEITTKMGLNTYSFFVGITIASAIATATPLANATIGMSLVANYKFSDYFKYAAPITFLSTLILLVMVPIIWPLA